MKKLSIFGIGAFALLATPAVSSAQERLGEVDDLLFSVLDVLDTLVLVIIALALVFFLWGLAKFIMNAGDEEERGKGKQIMIWGVLGLVIMTAIWGIVNFVSGTLGVEDDTIIAPGVIRQQVQ